MYQIWLDNSSQIVEHIGFSGAMLVPVQPRLSVENLAYQQATVVCQIRTLSKLRKDRKPRHQSDEHITEAALKGRFQQRRCNCRIVIYNRHKSFLDDEAYELAFELHPFHGIQY